MRKLAWLLVAVGLTLPAGILMAQSAYPTGPSPITCPHVAGTFTVSPALHALQPPAQAKKHETAAVVKATGKVSGCNDPVTSGTINLRINFREPTNCNRLLDLKAPDPVPSTTVTGSIAWKTGNKSTIVKGILTGPHKKLYRFTVTGTISAGIFAGSTISLSATFLPGKGQCTSKPFSSGTFAGGLTIS